MGIKQWRHALFPLFGGLTLLIGILTTYVIAVLKNHVNPVFPAISLAAIQSPEKYVLTLALNLSAGLGITSAVVRFKMWQVIISTYNNKSCHLYKLNVFCLIVGVVGSFGLALVGIFQFNEQPVIHTSAATVAFCAVCIYMMGDTYLSFGSYYKDKTCHLRWLRFVFATLATMFYIIYFVTSLESRKYLVWEDRIKQMQHWPPSLHGYTNHLVADVSEWMSVASFIAYIFSMVPDFCQTSVQLNVHPDINAEEMQLI